MRPAGERVIDVHFHVGLLGDTTPRLGALSDHFRCQPAYQLFLAYARVRPEQVCDRALRQRTLETIDSCTLVDQIVCLAIDPVFDRATGTRREDLSHLWVDNAYVVELRRELPERILLGASVHPYDPDFERRVGRCVDDGAVLLKWLPSAQAIDLADPLLRRRLEFLARARGSQPLPLLLHVGGEYAIPPADDRLKSYDFLSWTRWERLLNALRPRDRRLRTPADAAVRDNLRAGLDAGATIILAHCGFPYFAPGPLGRLVEHSDFHVVRDLLHATADREHGAGCCFADVSACCTPFRRSFFPDIEALPPGRVLFGSDFPTPVFELSAGLREIEDDLRAAVVEGDLSRLVIPEGNLVDVNYRELAHAFPGHPMFTTFGRLLVTPTE